MSVTRDFQVNGLFPSVVGGTGTTIKYFPKLLGSSIGVQSVAPSSLSAAGQLVVPGNNECNGQWIDVLVAGDLFSGVADSSVTAEVALYAQTSSNLSAPVYTKLATTGVYTALLESTHYTFGIKTSLLGDTASGVVRGYYTSFIGAQALTAPTTLVNNLSGINFGNNAPSSLSGAAGGPGTAGGSGTAYGLVVGVQFNSSDSGNSASLYQFQLAVQ